jgi:hypothetical protein
MKPMVLILLLTLSGCQGANDVSGPDRLESAPPAAARTPAADRRMPPAVVPGSRGANVVTRPPQATPTPRLYRSTWRTRTNPATSTDVYGSPGRNLAETGSRAEDTAPPVARS